MGQVYSPVGVSAGRKRTGTSLDQMQFGRDAEIWRIRGSSELRRVPFFCSDPIDSNLASNGHTFIDRNFMKDECGPIYVLESPNLTLLGGDGLLFYEGAPVYDTTFDLAPWEPQSNVAAFSAGHEVTVKSSIRRRRTITEGRYFIGFNGRFTNYCHWIQQMIPWHVAFLEMKQKIPELKLVLPPFEDGLFRYQTLRRLGISDSDTLIVNHDEEVAFQSAMFCSRFDLWKIPSFSVFAARTLAESVALEPSGEERIFIHRRVERRKFYNFDDHRELLEKFGFKVVEFENISVRRQIELLRGARYVIAEHGAGLINTMFCAPGARILELFNPFCVQPAFWSIASACGLEYGFVVGEHVSLSGFEEPSWNSAYRIGRKRMEDAIQRLISSDLGQR